MVGEEYGFVPLDGWTIALLTLQIVLIIIVPGFLLSLAIFPKRNVMAMSERMALSFGLGLAAPLVIYILNNSMNVLVNATLSWIIFAALCVIGFIGFVNRGGDPNLMKWYRGEE